MSQFFNCDMMHIANTQLHTLLGRKNWVPNKAFITQSHVLRLTKIINCKPKDGVINQI